MCESNNRPFGDYAIIETFEEQYKKLTVFEKNIVNTTSLSIDDIKHYESLLVRRLTQKELQVVSLLRNNGCILMHGDFNL